MRYLETIISSVPIVLLSMILLIGCVNLPENDHKTTSKTITGGKNTRLGKAFTPLLHEQVGKAGVILLSDGLDAFVGRAVLAILAEKSIDVQYYMFHQNTVGRMLIREFVKAADRGVRVRLLIDDMYGEEADDVWSALDTHPNMEVRLYNPFVRGKSKGLQMVSQAKRVNHRMHSKTYTVDNQITIVGGRNIGDEYFNADENVAFSDLDEIAIGPVVPQVLNKFDDYWSNRYSFPITTLIAGV